MKGCFFTVSEKLLASKVTTNSAFSQRTLQIDNNKKKKKKIPQIEALETIANLSLSLSLTLDGMSDESISRKQGNGVDREISGIPRSAVMIWIHVGFHTGLLDLELSNGWLKLIFFFLRICVRFFFFLRNNIFLVPHF